MRNNHALLGTLGGILLCSVIAVAQEHDHSQHTMMEAKSKPAAVEQDEKLPPGEDGAKGVLEKSPRHGEWLDIKYEGSDHPIRTWVVYPEKKEKAPVEVKKLRKTYEYEIYEGAGHGFLRAQSGREGANLQATQQAWPRMLSFLKKHL